jgi:hypothetical protein
MVTCGPTKFYTYIALYDFQTLNLKRIKGFLLPRINPYQNTFCIRNGILNFLMAAGFV